VNLDSILSSDDSSASANSGVPVSSVVLGNDGRSVNGDVGDLSLDGLARLLVGSLALVDSDDTVSALLGVLVSQSVDSSSVDGNLAITGNSSSDLERVNLGSRAAVESALVNSDLVGDSVLLNGESLNSGGNLSAANSSVSSNDSGDSSSSAK